MLNFISCFPVVANTIKFQNSYVRLTQLNFMVSHAIFQKQNRCQESEFDVLRKSQSHFQPWGRGGGGGGGCGTLNPGCLYYFQAFNYCSSMEPEMKVQFKNIHIPLLNNLNGDQKHPL